MPPRPVYNRVLLKLSGEALMGERPFGIDPDVVARIADEIEEVHELGVRPRSSSGAATSFAAWPPRRRESIASRGTTWACSRP